MGLILARPWRVNTRQGRRVAESAQHCPSVTAGPLANLVTGQDCFGILNVLDGEEVPVNNQVKTLPLSDIGRPHEGGLVSAGTIRVVSASADFHGHIVGREVDNRPVELHGRIAADFVMIRDGGVRLSGGKIGP
jgi:hypothetical protein